MDRQKPGRGRIDGVIRGREKMSMERKFGIVEREIVNSVDGIAVVRGRGGVGFKVNLQCSEFLVQVVRQAHCVARSFNLLAIDDVEEAGIEHV